MIQILHNVFKKVGKVWDIFPPNSLVICIYISVWRPWVDFQTCRHPLLCAARKRVAERRGGAALWEDNVRRLSNRASMTLPPAGLLDYQPFAASLTSAGPFTMETPHRSPPSAPSSQNPSEVTNRLLLKLVWGHHDNWPCAWRSDSAFSNSPVVEILWLAHWCRWIIRMRWWGWCDLLCSTLMLAYCVYRCHQHSAIVFHQSTNNRKSKRGMAQSNWQTVDFCAEKFRFKQSLNILTSFKRTIQTFCSTANICRNNK